MANYDEGVAKAPKNWRLLIPKSATSTSRSGDGLTEGQLEAMEEKAHYTILLCLDDNIIMEIAYQVMDNAL